MLEPDSGSWRYLEPTIHSGTLQEKNCPLCNSKLNLILPRLWGQKNTTIHNLLAGFETMSILESSSLWPVNPDGLSSSPIRKTRTDEAWLSLPKRTCFHGSRKWSRRRTFFAFEWFVVIWKEMLFAGHKNGHPRAAKVVRKKLLLKCPGHIFCSHFS